MKVGQVKFIKYLEKMRFSKYDDISVYLESSNSCNMLCFQLGTNANGVGNVASRSWNIKVCTMARFLHKD